MLIPSRHPFKLRPAAIPRDQFRRHLLEEGLRARWEMAARCPCWSADGAWGLEANLADAARTSSQPRPDCAQCGGKGRVYHSAQEIQVTVSASESTPAPYDPAGDVERGWAQISFLPEHLPSWGDRVTLLDTSIRLDERLVRTHAVQALRYPIVVRTLDTGAGPRFEEAAPMELGVLFVQGGGVDGQPGAVLAQSLDYLITAQGELDLRPGDTRGTAPPIGRLFSVSYYAHPVYVVTGHPHLFRDRWDTVKQGTTPQHMADLVQARARLEFVGGAHEAL